MHTDPATTAVPVRATITRAEWNRLHRDHKIGSPRAGTAKVLRWEEGIGTCLVPVDVVAS